MHRKKNSLEKYDDSPILALQNLQILSNLIEKYHEHLGLWFRRGFL
jgi:hypothetical protein